MVLTFAIAALLAQAPGSAAHATPAKTAHGKRTPVAEKSVIVSQQFSPFTITPTLATPALIAVDLHPMTEEEKHLYPGRERFDKTEWYESQFKGAKIVTQPEHVDEWNNGGLEQG